MKKLILVDSNVLIYAINQSSPKHEKAQNFLRENQNRLVLAHQNVLETIRVLTHPKFLNPMPPAKAHESIAAIADACTIINPDKTTYYLVMLLIKKHKLSDDRIFDAYLAATVLSNDISTIATDNTKDFQAFENLKIINPFI